MTKYRILGNVAAMTLCLAGAVAAADATKQLGTDTPEPLLGFGDVELGQSVRQLLDSHQLVEITPRFYDDTEKQVINGRPFSVGYGTTRAGTIEQIRLAADYKASEPDCRNQFDSLAQMFAKKYGAFDGPPKERTVAIGDGKLSSGRVLKTYGDRWLGVSWLSFGSTGDNRCQMFVHLGLGTAPVEKNDAGLGAADPTTSNEPTEPVEITFQNASGHGIRLAIPRAYLDRNSWDDTFVALKGVQFPDMLPPPPRRKLREVVKALEGHGQPSTVENLLKEWERDYPKHEDQEPLHYSGRITISPGIPEGTSRMIDSHVLRHPEYDDPLEPGFRHYRQANRDGTVAREYLIPREEFDARSIWIDCFSRDRPRRMCKVWTKFGDRLSLQYTIPRTDITFWREADSKVRSLVRQFVVDCFEGAQLEANQQPSTTYPCRF
jgi:hypothetical protein